MPNILVRGHMRFKDDDESRYIVCKGTRRGFRRQALLEEKIVEEKRRLY